MPLWLLLTVFVPILYLPGLGGFEALKIGLLLLASGLLLLIHLDKGHQRDELVLLRPRTSLAIATLLIYTVGRSFFTVAPNLTWLGSETSHLGAITWLGWLILLLIAANTKTTDHNRKLLTMASAIALFGLLLSVLGQMTHLSSIDWFSFDDPGRNRTLLGSIGSSSLLGVVLALYMVVILTAGSNVPKNWQRPIKVLLILGGITVVATKSLTGIGVIVLILTLWYLTQKHPLNKLLWQLLFVLVLLLPLLGTLIIKPLTASGLVPSLTDRLVLWQAGLKGVPDHPWFGQGVSLYQIDYDRYYPDNRPNTQVVTEENPHSIAVSWLVEWGIVGTLLWLTVIYCWYRESRFTRQAALLWLTVLVVSQLHFVIAANLLVILISTLLTTRPRHNHERTLAIRPSYWFILFTLAVVWFGIATLTGYSYWLTAYRNNRAGDVTQTLNFADSIHQYQLSLAQPLPLAFTQLQFAESYTNGAIQNNSFTDFTPVQTALQQAIKGSPTARHYSISLVILNEWSRQGFVEAQKMMQQQAALFISSEGQHPRYRGLIENLRQAGY